MSATASDAAASVAVRVGNGPWGAPRALALVTGRNTVEVRVTAEDGATIVTYTLTVTREPLRAGYCVNGRFCDLEKGQPENELKWAGAQAAAYIHGKGITCDTPPWGYIFDGLAPGTLGVPSGLYPYWRR